MKQLVQGQKELYNVGEPLGAFLALVAVALDGDLISTKVSLTSVATNFSSHPVSSLSP